MIKKKLISIMLIGTLVFSTAIAYGQSLLFSKYTGENYKHATRFDDALILNGIDVSQWNQNIDWNKVKADGIEYVIIRIGGRGYGPSGRLYFDDNAYSYIQGAKAAGLLVGGYYFSQAVTETEAIEEANYTKEILDRYNLDGDDFDLPIFMDREFISDEDGPGRLNLANLSKDTETKIEKAFCDRLKTLGFDSGLYANLLYLRDETNGNSLVDSGYVVWEAQYYDECEYQGKYSLWQYTSSGKVSGINTNTDCNFWYLNKSLEATQTTNTSIVGFKIDAPDVTIEGSGPCIPQITITSSVNSDTSDNVITLVEGTDYEILKCINNDKAGQAYAIIRGIGKYTGYRAVPYNIVLKGNLKSDTYKVDQFITGIPAETVSKGIIDKFTVDEEFSIKLLDSKGNDVPETSLIGTGMTVAIYDDTNTLIGTVPIVIKGDANGDGIIKATDYMKIKNHIMGTGDKLTGAYNKAADVNGDSVVKATDYMKIKNHIMGVSKI